MSHCALAVFVQSSVGWLERHRSIVGWSHSAWQPTKQSSSCGLHICTQVVPQLSVQLVVVVIAVQPPVQAASKLIGEHWALQPPETSILQDRPPEKSNFPQGVVAPASCALAVPVHMNATERATSIEVEARTNELMEPLLWLRLVGVWKAGIIRPLRRE